MLPWAVLCTCPFPFSFAQTICAGVAPTADTVRPKLTLLLGIRQKFFVFIYICFHSYGHQVGLKYTSRLLASHRKRLSESLPRPGHYISIGIIPASTRQTEVTIHSPSTHHFDRGLHQSSHRPKLDDHILSFRNLGLDLKKASWHLSLAQTCILEPWWSSAERSRTSWSGGKKKMQMCRVEQSQKRPGYTSFY